MGAPSPPLTMRRGARRNGRAGGLVAPREAARNAGRTVVDGVRAGGRDRNARPPPPGRAVADRGTDGTDRWIGGLGVRASQMGAFAPRRTGDDRRNTAAIFRDMRAGGGRTLTDIFRDIGQQPVGNGWGGRGTPEDGRRTPNPSRRRIQWGRSTARSCASRPGTSRMGGARGWRVRGRL